MNASWCKPKKSCLDWFINQKPVLGCIFLVKFTNSTVTGLTSQLHSMLSNRIHSYSTGSHGFREDCYSPWGKKTQSDRSSSHTHIKHYSVIKFSQMPRSSAQIDLLLWAVQGCQDYHDSKLLLLYSPLSQPHPPKMFLSFSLFQVWRVLRCQFITACVSAAFHSIYKSITIRHEGECEGLKELRGRGKLRMNEEFAWLKHDLMLRQLTPHRPCINIMDSGGT